MTYANVLMCDDERASRQQRQQWEEDHLLFFLPCCLILRFTICCACNGLVHGQSKQKKLQFLRKPRKQFSENI